MQLILVTFTKIENSVFQNNTALSKDGTMSVKLFRNILFNNLEFYGNKAKDFATFTLETSIESIYFSNLTFKDNQAQRDCGWYICLYRILLLFFFRNNMYFFILVLICIRLIKLIYIILQLYKIKLNKYQAVSLFKKIMVK